MFASLGVTLLLTACGNSDGGGSSPPPSGGCAGIDYAAYASAPTVSLKEDVMPIFGGSCTTTDCHNSPEKKAGLYLGVRCNTVNRVCTFPDAVDPNATNSHPAEPLTQEVLDAVYLSLTSPSTTAPSAQRVVKNDPEHSFLIQKLAGTQADHGYECENQDPSHTSNPQPCGDSMPLGSTALCEGSSRDRFDKIAAWIAQGANEN
ncbi:MAG TPA: hypothetical protein VHE30_17485 [Polyangiaceae bacterium]|nr:hypothetical protein [Polyangiaceae bacterium]